MANESSASKKPMIGEVLVKYGIITQNMLKNALRRQSQVGGQIGSILIEMGYITTDTLLDFLSKQFGVPSVNLFKIDVPNDVLKAMPLEKIKEYKVLPLEIDNKLTLAMVNPKDYVAIRDVEFILGKRVNPVVVPSLQLEAAIKSIESRGMEAFRGSELEISCAKGEIETGAADIQMLLKYLRESKATDLQLTAGVPPSLKMSTELKRMNMPPLTPDNMKNYAQTLMDDEQQATFQTASNLDFAFTNKEYGRFRVNIYKQRNSVSITLRRIPDVIPTLPELGISEDLENFALKTQGLILITGPAGHGKSTTLAALVDIINTKRRCNIITLEDPIEYLHKHKNSNVNQREIGIDTASFQDGLRHIFRQDPDVIVIGEMRDPESFKIALQAAETGHLVLSTLHSRNATSTIERVIDIFPPDQQSQIRSQLADSLLLVLSQRLVMKKDKSVPVLAYEKLVNSYKIKNFIRDGKLHQIRSQMQLPGEEYSSIDVSLIRLTLEGLITGEEGSKHADNLTYYQDGIRGKGLR
ncbi:MAG: PilT/PilU family type 4a pilus ATPase [Nitrospirae bacterium]|nr:PilT/PilU family type 4a pilus ATPase [Nitrospirota bacterium]